MQKQKGTQQTNNFSNDYRGMPHKKDLSQGIYDNEALIIEQTVFGEFPKFLNYRKNLRKDFIQSNKELVAYYKKKLFKEEEIKIKKCKIFSPDSTYNTFNSFIVEEEEYQNPEQIFPGENINTSASIFTLENKVKIPTGIFCFPCKENFRTEETFEIKYMIKIEKFEKFEEIMEHIKPFYDDWFSDYPHNLDDSEKIENNFFIIFIFFKAMGKISAQFGEIDKKLNHLIQIFSNIIGKKFNIVYKILSNFWVNLKKKLKAKINQAKPSSISKYREFYCQICFQYFCKIHFYNFPNISTEVNLKNYKIYKKELKKSSGTVSHSIRTDFAMMNKMRVNNYTNNKNKIEKDFVCSKTKSKSDCKHNFDKDSYGEITNTSYVRGWQKNLDENLFNLFSEISDKREFYLLCCLVMSDVFSNSCFTSRFIFRGKYKCHVLNKLIAVFQNDTLLGVIDEYLNINLKSKSSPLNYDQGYSGKFPQISKEKLKINYITDIPNYSQKKLAKPVKTKAGYTPCSHEGICTKENCECVRYKGSCEKFCSCREFCEYQYKGCDCKEGCVSPELDLNSESKCSSICKCLLDLRECDPDICSCKGSDIYYKNSEDYAKRFKNSLKGVNSLCRNMSMNYNCFKLTTLGRTILCDSYGLFALEDIETNDLICEYTGEILHKEETDRRTLFHDRLGLNYLFTLTEDIDIDAYRIGNEMRYVNHSSHGYQNCYARTKYIRGNYKICLYAGRKILKGEELFFDYFLKVNVPWLTRYNRYYG